MGLRVLAIAPPEFEKNFLSQGDRMSSVNSDTPYALLATLSPAFEMVRSGVLDIINWQDPKSIRESVFLMHHWHEEKDMLAEKVGKNQPDIVFIGTFAMNFPGAIEVAKIIRELSPQTLIVLGGRHIGETFWSDMQGSTFGQIREHTEANPLRLMEGGKIPDVFDIVVAHDGQMLIPAMIQAIEAGKQKGKIPREIVKNLSQFEDVSGYWTMGRVENGTVIFQQPKSYIKSDISGNRSPYIYRGTDEVHFAVFESTDWTAHVHSDSQGISANNCTQNCGFCSEASGKVPIKQAHESEAGDRLFARFNDIIEVAKGDKRKPSIFVEDSILCGGHWGAMERFCELLEEAKIEGKELPLEWGCQFTVPMIIHTRGDAIIRRLQQCGLSYIYFGLESAKPEIAASIGKTGGRSGWSDKAETAVASLSEMGIKVGTSNIFAMGESHEDRMKQLALIQSWQNKYSGNPVVYSLNLQTVHPGEWGEHYQGNRHSYDSWGLDGDDPRNPLIQELFGEAAVKYLRLPRELPSLAELKEIKEFLGGMSNTTLNSINFSHALGIRKRQINPEVLELMRKNPEEILRLAHDTADKLLLTQGHGKILFTPGITLGLAEVLNSLFLGRHISIVFGDHELKHTLHAIGNGTVSNHETTWSSFGPKMKVKQCPGTPLRQHEVLPVSHFQDLVQNQENLGRDQLDTLELLKSGEIRTYADVFYLSRISRLTGEILLTTELYKQLKKQYPGCVVICDGAQSLGAIVEDVSKYCDIYLGLTSKFIGASPHLGIAWISQNLCNNNSELRAMTDISVDDFMREYTELVHYGLKAVNANTTNAQILQKRVKGLFENVGLIYVGGDHLMTFRMAPEGYFAKESFARFCHDMLPFLRSQGIDISLNLPYYSVGYDMPSTGNEYLRISINHETTAEDVEKLEKALGEYTSHVRQ